MFTEEYPKRDCHGYSYAKAQKFAWRLRDSYEQMLGAYDLLKVPATAMMAQPMLRRDEPLALILKRAFESLENAAPYDVTGRRAMSIPCAMSDGLSIGSMLVGKYCAKSTIYQAAAASKSAGEKGM